MSGLSKNVVSMRIRDERSILDMGDIVYEAILGLMGAGAKRQ
jgi:hypothetical protein